MTHLDGAQTDLELHGDLGERKAFEVAKLEEPAIGGAQSLEGRSCQGTFFIANRAPAGARAGGRKGIDELKGRPIRELPIVVGPIAIGAALAGSQMKSTPVEQTLESKPPEPRPVRHGPIAHERLYTLSRDNQGLLNDIRRVDPGRQPLIEARGDDAPQAMTVFLHESCQRRHVREAGPPEQIIGSGTVGRHICAAFSGRRVRFPGEARDDHGVGPVRMTGRSPRKKIPAASM